MISKSSMDTKYITIITILAWWTCDQLSRSYYRCTYREQNCFATKTIEQQEQIDDTSTGEEIAKYTVVYYGDHTCKDHSVSIVQLPQLVCSMDLQNMEMAQTSSSVQDPEADLDLPALLGVFDNSLIDWEDSWKIWYIYLAFHHTL